MADLNLRIKQITLPSGSTYQVYDEATRLMITAKFYTTGVAYSAGDLVVYHDANNSPDKLYHVTSDITASANTGWSTVDKTETTIDIELKNMRAAVSGIMKYYGTTTTPISDGSTTSTIKINGENVTFTSDMAGYVVIAPAASGEAAGTPKEYVWSGTTWNEFGSTGSLKALAFKDSATGTYDKTTSATVNMTTVNPTVSHLGATASGGAVSITNTAKAITGFGTHSKTNFVTSYPGTTSKLATTTVRSAGADVSIPNVTGVSAKTATNTVLGTEKTASKVSSSGSTTVAKRNETSTTVGTGVVTGTESSSRDSKDPNKSVMWGASVNNETLSFTFKTLGSESVYTCDTADASIPNYTFTDVPVPFITSNDTVTSSEVTLGTAISAAGAGSNVTVATGSLSATASGASVMTGLGTAVTSQAITDLGTPTTANAATAISMSTQPTITLAVKTASDTTTADVVTGVSTGTTNANVTLTHTATSITVQ